MACFCLEGQFGHHVVLTHVPSCPHTMGVMCLYASTIDLWLQCSTRGILERRRGTNSGRSHKCLGVCGKGRREDEGRLYGCEREKEGGILGDSLNVWMCVGKKEGVRREIVRV